MIRRPPRSTLTDTLFPYPTLFRPPVLTPLGEEIPIALIVAEQAGGLAEHRVSDVVRGHRIAVEMHANLSRRERRVRVVNQLGLRDIVAIDVDRPALCAHSGPLRLSCPRLRDGR